MTVHPPAVLAEVKASTGIQFTATDTGGGHIAWEARLESGHWIVATNEALDNMRYQIAWEADNEAPLGWAVGIYEEEDGWWGGGQEPILFHIDLDAYAQDMAQVVSAALAIFATYKIRSDR